MVRKTSCGLWLWLYLFLVLGRLAPLSSGEEVTEEVTEETTETITASPDEEETVNGTLNAAEKSSLDKPETKLIPYRNGFYLWGNTFILYVGVIITFIHISYCLYLEFSAKKEEGDEEISNPPFFHDPKIPFHPQFFNRVLRSIDQKEHEFDLGMNKRSFSTRRRTKKHQRRRNK